MTKAKNGKVGLTIGIVLTLIFAITLASLVYVFFCVDFVDGKRDMVISYKALKTVMENDVLYLSDDFIEDNNLKIDPLYSRLYPKENGQNPKRFYVGDVVLEYDCNKTKIGMNNSSVDFGKRVEKIDLYRYELISDDASSIPVRVSVVGAVGTTKKVKYDKEVGNGDKYAALDKELTTYFKGIGKSYEVKGQVGKSGLIKKYSRLKITVIVDAQNVNKYTKEQVEERVDELLNSALKYIARYGE